MEVVQTPIAVFNRPYLGGTRGDRQSLLFKTQEGYYVGRVDIYLPPPPPLQKKKRKRRNKVKVKVKGVKIPKKIMLYDGNGSQSKFAAEVNKLLNESISNANE